MGKRFAYVFVAWLFLCACGHKETVVRYVSLDFEAATVKSALPFEDNLVKTLDFKIYLGLLSETYNEAHQKDLARTQGVAIDMVVVNLYPFQKTVAREGVTPEEARTNIDIGGPCMVRASAKIYLRVASVTDPADYAKLIDELSANKGTLAFETRLALMKKAFAHTAQYDTAIAAFFAGVTDDRARSTYSIHDTI